MPTVDSKILVGGENERICKRFGHANQASIGKSHRNVGILLDQFHDWLHVLGKREDEGGRGGEVVRRDWPTWVKCLKNLKS